MLHSSRRVQGCLLSLPIEFPASDALVFYPPTPGCAAATPRGRCLASESGTRHDSLDPKFAAGWHTPDVEWHTRAAPEALQRCAHRLPTPRPARAVGCDMLPADVINSDPHTKHVDLHAQTQMLRVAQLAPDLMWPCAPQELTGQPAGHVTGRDIGCSARLGALAGHSGGAAAAFEQFTRRGAGGRRSSTSRRAQ